MGLYRLVWVDVVPSTIATLAHLNLIGYAHMQKCQMCGWASKAMMISLIIAVVVASTKTMDVVALTLVIDIG